MHVLRKIRIDGCGFNFRDVRTNVSEHLWHRSPMVQPNAGLDGAFNGRGDDRHHDELYVVDVQKRRNQSIDSSRQRRRFHISSLVRKKSADCR